MLERNPFINTPKLLSWLSKVIMEGMVCSAHGSYTVSIIVQPLPFRSRITPKGGRPLCLIMISSLFFLAFSRISERVGE